MIRNLILTLLSGVFCAIALFLLFAGAPSDRTMLFGVLAFFGGCAIVGASLLAGDLKARRPAPTASAAASGTAAFRHAFWFHLAFGIASLGMTFGAVAFALESPFMWLVAAPALILFGGGGLMFLHRALFDRAIVVRIDAEGVLDRRILARPIPWDAVEAIGFPQIGPVPFLLILARDAQTYMRPRGPLRRWMGRGQVADGQVMIAFQGLDGGLTDALAAIGARKPDVAVLGDFTD